jgi:hypothetical protein
MKAFALWLSVAVAPISLASAFAPSSRFANPGPLLTKRGTPFFSITEDVASLNTGSEDDTVTDSDLKLISKVLEKLRGTGVKEIHDHVVEDSDADAHEFDGTQSIVEELDAPGQDVTPEALAEVAPALDAKNQAAPENAVINTVHKVIKILAEAKFADWEDELSYGEYPAHKEVSKTSSSR